MQRHILQHPARVAAIASFAVSMSCTSTPPPPTAVRLPTLSVSHEASATRVGQVLAVDSEGRLWTVWRGSEPTDPAGAAVAEVGRELRTLPPLGIPLLWSFESVGDVDGDGLADFGWEADLVSYDGTELNMTYAAPEPQDTRILRSAGDIDRDGRDDLLVGWEHYALAPIVGAPTTTALGWSATRSGAVKGAPGLLWSYAPPDSLTFESLFPTRVSTEVSIREQYAEPSQAMATYDWGEGAVYALGLPERTASDAGSVVIFDPGSSTSFELPGRAGQRFGHTLLFTDVNSDGIDDLVVGAPGPEPPDAPDDPTELSQPGQVQVWIGPLSAPRDPDHVVTTGRTMADGLGYALASWDTDGDGTEEILAGAPYLQTSGAIFVLGSSAF